MTEAQHLNLRARLLLGGEHPCGYLPGRSARSAFLDPALHLSSRHYAELLEQGFRRSGGLVYRPICAQCQACQSLRLPVAEFRPSRAQRRNLARNRDLQIEEAARLDTEHYALYRRYLAWRHPEGGMDPDDAGAFHEFLESPWGDVGFWTFRLDGAMVACAVVDRLPQGLSAVYSFYAPEHAGRGLGTHAVLRLIEAARAEGLRHLYLGYWVPGSPTMDYKRRFRPLELLTREGWTRLDAC